LRKWKDFNLTEYSSRLPEFLESKVQRPGRYTGLEWNLAPLPEKPSIRAALSYPDVYEIGMSHPGLHILHHILSTRRDVAVERIFAPWPDAEHRMRNRNLPLTSLESFRPVSEFDVVFFTLPHELAFTNILNILDLGGIPLCYQDRQTGHPIIIGGGIGTMNPEPLRTFFDAFIIGDGEEVILEVVDAIKELGGKDCSRAELYPVLNAINGCFVPEKRPVTGSNTDIPPVRKRRIHHLDSAPFPCPPLVPFCQPVHERVVVEAARGCPRQCRFCQARVYYSPVRTRSPDQILEIIDRSLNQTGYDEVSLLSLNIADYPEIENLTETLMKILRKRNTSLSLPSLRPEKLTSILIEQIKSVRKTGFTLAPEAGTDRLRKIIGKPYDTGKLLTGVQSVFSAGWSVLKLYFMIGQPFETDSDVEGIVKLVRQIRQIGRSAQRKKASIHVSVSTFIPKPHTPFQWAGQADRDVLRRRLGYLRKSLRMPGVKLSFHDITSSRLETLIARGNLKTGSAIRTAFQNGCRFDAWNEWFKPEIWQKAFQEEGIDFDGEPCRNWDIEDELPWDGIDPGLPKSDLINSYRHAGKIAGNRELESEEPFKMIHVTPNTSNRSPDRPKSAVRSYRYFGLFSVKENYRLFKHLEINSAIIRAARRAHFPMEYSYGFNPRPRFSFSSPAPLGFELYAEPFEFRLTRSMPASKVLSGLANQLPTLMTVSTLMKIPEGYDSVLQRLKSITYAFQLDPDSMNRFTHSFGTSFKTYTNSEECIGSRMFSSECERFNLFLVYPLNQPDIPKFRTVLQTVFQEEYFPFHKTVAARICWNLDEYGMMPLTIEIPED
jgi:radical SAM family uncharacterized protein/radical SAM-linked protein